MGNLRTTPLSGPVIICQPVEELNNDVEMKEEPNTSDNNIPPNFSYLTKRFKEQIGVPMNRPMSMNIFNFDETLIAKGFDRVVTTWQGMFWEHSKEDICFRNLSKVVYSVDGVEGWRANGVSVFRLTQPDRRSRPRAHRFAVNPPAGFNGKCNPLRVGKFYSHIYQTKVQVGRELRTLRSKHMALELKKMFGNEYRPRKFDIIVRTNHKSPVARQRHLNIPPQVSNFQPLAQLQTVPPYSNYYSPVNAQPTMNNHFNQQ